MKVVKCLERIPKEYWGQVIRDDETHLYFLDEIPLCRLKPSDTFPLPKQGDKVEVFNNNNWSEYCNWYFLSYCDTLSCPFIVYDNDKDVPCSFKYIRPVEETAILRIDTTGHFDELCLNGKTYKL